MFEEGGFCSMEFTISGGRRLELLELLAWVFDPRFPNEGLGFRAWGLGFRA